MAGIKRRLGSLLGPRGYNATGAAEDQQTIASYMAARIGANPVSEALDEAIGAQTTPVRSRANAAHALAQNVSGRVDAFEVLTDTRPGNADDAIIGLHVSQRGSLARDAVANVVLDVSTNLYDDSQALAGMTMSAGSDEITPNSAVNLSELIPVSSGREYTFFGVEHFTWLDTQQRYVGHGGGAHSSARTVTAPAEAAYVRVVVANTMRDTAQINTGSTLLPYEPGRAPKVKPEHLPEDTGVQDGEVTPVQTTFFEFSTNLFNADKITAGVYYPPGSGELADAPGQSVSDWIPVTAGTEYSYAGLNRVTYFDDHLDYVQHNDARSGGIYNGTAPDRAVWARITYPLNNPNRVQMNQSPELLPYEPGRAPKVKPEHLPPPEINLDPHAHRHLFALERIEGWYEAPTVEAQPDLVTGLTDATDVYGWYDNLMTDHPEYITRTHIGETQGIPLYSYTFKAPEVPTAHGMEHNPSLQTKPPAIFLLSGVHGGERAAVYNVWRTAKAIADEWDTSQVLEDLRWNFEIVIIPLGNPWGYNEGSGVNANGVDVMRNFTVDWYEGDPESGSYGGPSPLSEPEAVAIQGVLEEISDRAILGLDCHNFSSRPELPEVMVWHDSPSPMARHLGKKHISKISRVWNKRYDWIQNPAPYYGYVTNGVGGGSTLLEIQKYGMLPALFETSRLQYMDGGDGDRHGSRALTLSLDALVNFLAMGVNTALSIHRTI